MAVDRKYLDSGQPNKSGVKYINGTHTDNQFHWNMF